MIVNEISLWGAALVAIIIVIAMIALAFVDSKMLRRMLVIFGATVAQMIVVGAVVLLAFKTFAWWYLLILFLSICWVLYPVHFMWKRALLPVSAAMLAGSIVVGGCTILCLPMNVYLTVYSVLMACLTASMIQTMVNYLRSQHGSPMNPGAPKQELSWRESVLPQIRSMAQPLVMVYAGMLLGGISAHIGLIVILMLIAASFVANVLAGMIALSMIHKEVRKV